MKIHNEKFEGITVSKFMDCKPDIDINGVDADGVTLKSVKLSYFEDGSLHIADSKITNSKIQKCEFRNEVTFDNIVINDCIFAGTKIDHVHSFKNIEINNSKNKDCQWSMFTANDCKIVATVFDNQECRFVDMNNCVLKDLQITNGTYDRMKYCNCKFTNVCIDSLRIYEESISDCEFANVSYSNVKFDKCKYNNVDLSEVVFENCQFVNCEFENCKMTDEQKVMFGVVVMLDSMTVDEIAKRLKDYTSVKKYSEILELSSKLIEDKWDYRITVFVLDAMNELNMYEDALKLAKEKETLCKDHMLAWNRAVAKAYCGIGEYKESFKYILAAYECTESEKFDKHDINRLGYIVTEINNNIDDIKETELMELQLKESNRRKDIDNLLHNMRQEELRQMREKVNEISEEDIIKGNWELSTILDDLEKHVDCGSTLADFMETGAKYTDAQLKIYALYMYDW